MSDAGSLDSGASSSRHQDIVINVGGDVMAAAAAKRGSLISAAADQRGGSSGALVHHMTPAAAAPAPLVIRHTRTNVLAKLLQGATIILAFGSGFFASAYLSFGAGVLGTFGLVLQEYVASSALAHS